MASSCVNYEDSRERKIDIYCIVTESSPSPQCFQTGACDTNRKTVLDRARTLPASPALPDQSSANNRPCREKLGCRSQAETPTLVRTRMRISAFLDVCCPLPVSDFGLPTSIPLLPTDLAAFILFF